MSVAGREICRDLAVDTQQFLPVSLAKGWHPVEIAFEPRGVPRLEILMGGDRVLAAPRARHASLARFPREPKVEGATKGKPIAVPAEGLVLSWSRSVSKLGGVTLFPAAKSKTFPTSWTVEVSSGRNRWKAVKNAVVHVPAAAKKRPVAFVEITFKSTRAKKLRVRPGTPGAVTLSRVDVLRAK